MSHPNANFPVAVATVTSRAQAMVLTSEDEKRGVFNECIILDSAINPANYGQDLIDFLNAHRTSDEAIRQLVKVTSVPMSETGTHVFVRAEANDKKMDLFRCAGCGLTVRGRPTDGHVPGAPRSGHAPYVLTPDYAQSRRYYAPCARNQVS